MGKGGSVRDLGREVGRRSFGNLMYDEEMRAAGDADGGESGPGCGTGCLVAVGVAAAALVIVFLLV